MITIYYEDYYAFFAQRLAQLRETKGVTAKDMSLDIGQNESYISSLERKVALPSFQGILYICDYFGISPKGFFDVEIKQPGIYSELMRNAKQLSGEQLKTINDLVKGLIIK